MIDAIAERKGKALKGLLDAAKEEKKDFQRFGDEVEAYGHKADDKFIYEGLGLQAELWFKTTVAMTAQAIDLICPYLYPADPYRCGHVRPHPNPQVHQIAIQRNDLMTKYLNFTPEETDLYGESVRAINQSQTYGMGVMWTGFNQRKGLVQSVYDSIENFFVDPDAVNWNEVNWVGRKRQGARWKLLNEFPDQAQVIAGLQPDKTSKSQLGKGNDLITYFEVWMRVGLQHFIEGGLPTTDENGDAVQLDDAPKKYVVSKDGKLLAEGTWEIPFFMDDLWPCEPLSYIDDKDSIWPLSPMRAGLPFQKALNWLYIFYLTKIRFCSRSLFAIMEYADTDVTDDVKKTLELWNDLPFVTVRTQDGQRKIGDIFQQLNLDPQINNFEAAHQIIKREFQEHTGMYDILHYGESDTQDRSATATNFKDKTSKTRINYRLDRVVKWQSRLARKEAMAARFLHTPEQIDDILGPGSGQIWGQIMPPTSMPGDPMAVDFRQWFLETDYSIVSSSMRRHDYDAEVDALKEMMNQSVPTQMQSPDPNVQALAYDTMAEYYQKIGSSDYLVDQTRAVANTLRQQAAAMQAQQAQMMAQQGQPGQQPLPGPGSAPALPAPPAAGGY